MVHALLSWPSQGIPSTFHALQLSSLFIFSRGSSPSPGTACRNNWATFSFFSQCTLLSFFLFFFFSLAQSDASEQTQYPTPPSPTTLAAANTVTLGHRAKRTHTAPQSSKSPIWMNGDTHTHTHARTHTPQQVKWSNFQKNKTNEHNRDRKEYQGQAQI